MGSVPTEAPFAVLLVILHRDVAIQVFVPCKDISSRSWDPFSQSLWNFLVWSSLHGTGID